MKEIKPPQVLTDVYRDLRDRHLLLPALALIVGLVAVPMLLKDSPPPAPAPPAPASSGADSAVTAAVLAEDTVSVRNYRKRLDELKSKNPFEPQFEVPAGGDGSAAGSTSGGGDTAPTAGGTTGGDPLDVAPVPTLPGNESGTTIDETTVDETDTTGDGGGGGGGNGNGGGSDPSSDDVEVVGDLFTRRVDLLIGLQGDPKLRENVKPMTILPDPATPVVAFLGTDEKGKRAAFVVARDATVIAGDGACVPTPENCLYITLQKNETATLDFGPDGQTFDLRLLEIRDVELKAE